LVVRKYEFQLGERSTSRRRLGPGVYRTAQRREHSGNLENSANSPEPELPVRPGTGSHLTLVSSIAADFRAFEHGSMSTRATCLFGLLLGLAATSATPVFAQGQGKVFDWLPANDESVRMDPANYHTGRTYRPGPQGGSIHVDIDAQRPVTIALTSAEDWNAALQRPELIGSLNYLCLREHVVKTTYLCDLPAQPMTLIIRDERISPDRAVFAGLGAVLDVHDKVDRAVGVGIATVFTGEGSPTRRFAAPNDIHIQYYRWACISNCFPPEFQWIRQVKEKYDLTSFLKVYGGFTPERDGQQVSVKIKSPVPMVVAIVPSDIAGQLHGKTDALETALERNSCQQRGVQTLEFQCTFSAADGPQSLIVGPEPGGHVPSHKKAEIEMLASKCVANCIAPAGSPQSAENNNQ
jgi:hypothetical protein